jgi:hypothetical protein
VFQVIEKSSLVTASGTSETCGDEERKSAYGGNPDIRRTSWKDRV